MKALNKARSRGIKWWLLLPLRIAHYTLGEIVGLFVFVIQQWPNTPVGLLARRLYWQRKTGLRRIQVWRGANIFDCDWIDFGENLMVGENTEIISDGVDGLKIYLGPNVVFARGVYLRSANHRFEDPTRPLLEQGHTSKRVDYHGTCYAVVIEGNCWIGANSIILSGAHIGKGAVIGAGSVVTGVVPAGCVAAGVPARVLSKREDRVNA